MTVLTQVFLNPHSTPLPNTLVPKAEERKDDTEGNAARKTARTQLVERVEEEFVRLCVEHGVEGPRLPFAEKAMARAFPQERPPLEVGFSFPLMQRALENAGAGEEALRRLNGSRPVLTTGTFFWHLHNLNVKHNTDLRTLVNRAYNESLRTKGLEHFCIPEDSLGNNNTHPIWDEPLYVAAWEQVLGQHGIPVPPEVTTYKTARKASDFFTAVRRLEAAYPQAGSNTLLERVKAGYDCREDALDLHALQLVIQEAAAADTSQLFSEQAAGAKNLLRAQYLGLPWPLAPRCTVSAYTPNVVMQHHCTHAGATVDYAGRVSSRLHNELKHQGLDCKHLIVPACMQDNTTILWHRHIGPCNEEAHARLYRGKASTFEPAISDLVRLALSHPLQLDCHHPIASATGKTFSCFHPGIKLTDNGRIALVDPTIVELDKVVTLNPFHPSSVAGVNKILISLVRLFPEHKGVIVRAAREHFKQSGLTLEIDDASMSSAVEEGQQQMAFILDHAAHLVASGVNMATLDKQVVVTDAHKHEVRRVVQERHPRLNLTAVDAFLNMIVRRANEELARRALMFRVSSETSQRTLTLPLSLTDLAKALAEATQPQERPQSANTSASRMAMMQKEEARAGTKQKQQNLAEARDLARFILNCLGEKGKSDECKESGVFASSVSKNSVTLFL